MDWANDLCVRHHLHIFQSVVLSVPSRHRTHDSGDDDPDDQDNRINDDDNYFKNHHGNFTLIFRDISGWPRLEMARS